MIFHSYVSLPEGTSRVPGRHDEGLHPDYQIKGRTCETQPGVGMGWRVKLLGICNPQFKIEVGDELLISIVCIYYMYVCFLFWISIYNFVV